MQTSCFYQACNGLAQGLHDRWILALIKQVFFIGKPNARRMLRHYLDGSGQTQDIDLAAWIQTDPGLRGWLIAQVRDQPSGEAIVPQWQLANRDMRYAVGSFSLSWQRSSKTLSLQLSACYDWHPAENRVTRRMHQAADRMKTQGARAFQIEGAACMPLDALVGTEAWIPRDRLYL